MSVLKQMDNFVTVYVRPNFGYDKTMLERFQAAGFNVLGLRRLPDYSFVALETLADAQRFIRFFDGTNINGVRLMARISNRTQKGIEEGRNMNSPNLDQFTVPLRNDPKYSIPAPSSSRTVKVRWTDDRITSERILFDDFRELGFIRHVKVRNGEGFIEFDTPADAKNVCNVVGRSGTMRGKRVEVSIVGDMHLGVPNYVIQLAGTA